MTQIQIIYLIGGVAAVLLIAVIALLVVRSRLKSDLVSMAQLVALEKAGLEEKLASSRQQLDEVRADLVAVENQLDQRRDAIVELEAKKAALAQTAARVPQLEDALEKANSTPFGLAAYVFTRSTRTAFLASEGLDVGMVGVNNLVIATAEAPFGGVRESGFGREGGSEGIEAYTVAKYVNLRL